MKHLIIQQLHVENFQKFQRETFDFNENRTVVKGENRAGKTTIQSAMLWLLFGKDSYGQSDTGRGAFDIKRREEGETIPHTDVTVEGIFVLHNNGTKETIHLKRVLHECWNKKNEYTGDETQCFVNEVPYKVGDYQEYISSFIPEDEFRMISSVGHFNTLKTDFKRNYLCAMAGVQSMEDIVAASSNEKWKQFLSDISGKTLEDALKQIAYERKALKKEYESIDPQIQALNKVMPEEQDWIAIDEEIKGKNIELGLIDESLRDAGKAMKLHQEHITNICNTVSAKRKEFYNITQQIEDAKQKAVSKAKQELYRKDEERNTKKAELDSLEKERTTLSLSKNTTTLSVDKFSKQMQELMNQYKKEQETVFQAKNDTVICPLLKDHVCKSPELLSFIAENQEKARAEFNVKQQEKLQQILSEGRAIKAQKDEAEKQLSEIEQKLAETTRKIEALTVVVNSMPIYSNKAIDESTLVVEGKEELESRRISINGEIAELEKQAEALQSTPSSDDEELKQKKAALMNDIAKLNKQLGVRDQIDSISTEIEALEEKGKKLASQITDLENKEIIARDINRAIVDDATERVNKLFDITTWQLFEQQKNGLYAEVCKPTINGVCNSLNSEARINIGIDICNAISTFVGMSAPLFIDNAESVNELLTPVGQSIEMYVAPKGTKLTLSTNS